MYEIKTALKSFQLKIMIPSPVPKELQGLTQIEEMLIAHAFPVISVYTKSGGQRHIKVTASISHKTPKSLQTHCQDIQKNFL